MGTVFFNGFVNSLDGAQLSSSDVLDAPPQHNDEQARTNQERASRAVAVETHERAWQKD